MDEFKQLSPSENTAAEGYPSLSSLLQLNGKTIADLLTYEHKGNLISLSKTLGRSIREVEDYLRKVKLDIDRTIEPNCISQKLESLLYIKTGLESVDQQLGGGIPLGEVTEIFGESGTGKSHLLFQLSLECIKLSKEVIHITTESFLETKRLSDVFETYKANGQDLPMDAISYVYCQDLESQDHILYTQLPVLLKKRKVGLVVIDSIAHHFRRENAITNSLYMSERIQNLESQIKPSAEFAGIKYNHEQQLKKIKQSTTYRNRSSKFNNLYSLHRHLVRIAREHNLAVAVVNQVSDAFSNWEHEGDPLNLDYQLAINSGWSYSTLYNHFNSCGENQNSINGSVQHIESPYNNFKRYKPSHSEGTVPSDLSHCQNQSMFKSKMQYPTLGYPWSKRIQNRISLSKVYLPKFTEENQMSSRDLESGLTYSQLCDGFNINSSINEKTQLAGRKREHFTSSIEGWSVKRYMKVITSSHNPRIFTSSVEFVVDKSGLSEKI